MHIYQVSGRLSKSEDKKTVVIQEMFNPAEAMDYVAMFHNIDEIYFIKKGCLIKGVFVETINTGLITPCTK